MKKCTREQSKNCDCPMSRYGLCQNEESASVVGSANSAGRMNFTSTDLLEMADAFEPTSRVYRALRQAAADREDAERYRWLRMNTINIPGLGPKYLKKLDEACDRKIAARQESRHG